MLRAASPSATTDSMSKLASLPQRETRPVARAPGGRVAELSVVVPTFKERDNVVELVQRLEAALEGVEWEVIFVDDDSPDGTSEIVKEIAAIDSRVRCLRRVSRRGLAGACIEGMLASSAPYVAVMDADLQHDENLLPRMLATLRDGETDMVVGSRYIAGGDAKAFSKRRGFLSKAAGALARMVTRIELTDPMSGFFMMRRDRFDPIASSLSTQGFKILLDIVLTAKGGLRIVEEPYVFGSRTHGESKLDAQVGLDFLGLLLTKLTGGAVGPRFLSYALVGTIGIFVHLAALRLALLAFTFEQSQAIATLIAMTGNFLLNNSLTFRDSRLSGFAWVKGLLLFYLVSSVGALTNVGVASWFYAYQPTWWLAGLAGALMGVVWNYSMSTLFVWRAK
jgi:dolichol-phosphate mannosyltransferase